MVLIVGFFLNKLCIALAILLLTVHHESDWGLRPLMEITHQHGQQVSILSQISNIANIHTDSGQVHVCTHERALVKPDRGGVVA
jgi:hypothetical protein